MNTPHAILDERSLASVTFQREREAAWLDLEHILDELERRGPRGISPEDLAKLPTLYQSALSSLNVARSLATDGRLISYLEALCSRAHLLIQAEHQGAWQAVQTFLSHTLPLNLWLLRRHVAAAYALLAIGAMSAAALVSQEPELFYLFVEPAYAQGRGPEASPEALLDALQSSSHHDASTLFQFASLLFTHNAKIGMLCFASGALFGLPVLYLLLANGATMGAFLAIYAVHGLTPELLTWLLPHALPELTAIALCAGGGLYIADAMIFPHERGRLHGVRLHARRASALAIGAIPLFLIAGAIEGVFRQLVYNPLMSALIVAFTLMLFIAYASLGARRAREATP
jgi:uncharacterized membrane protein SpoIIM required for sporulation